MTERYSFKRSMMGFSKNEIEQCELYIGTRSADLDRCACRMSCGGRNTAKDSQENGKSI